MKINKEKVLTKLEDMRINGPRTIKHLEEGTRYEYYKDFQHSYTKYLKISRIFLGIAAVCGYVSLHNLTTAELYSGFAGAQSFENKGYYNIKEKE